MIKINLYNSIHQSGIDAMMLEISKEFGEQILSKPTSSTPIVPNTYWVALKNSQVVGTTGIITINGEAAVLKKMMLLKEFRGNKFGVSKLLLHTAISWCKENEITKIYLGTMNQFRAAQIFYEKNGFTKIKESELPIEFLKNPLDKIFFELTLN